MTKLVHELERTGKKYGLQVYFFFNLLNNSY